MLRLAVCLTALATSAPAEERTVYLESVDGDRIAIATIDLGSDGTYAIAMNDDAFSDHFLSMRPFKCLEGPGKHWCHVPYPYDITRDISADPIDLEYDFLFVWKNATDYGINMWNGLYYRIDTVGDTMVGQLHEMDMDLLSAPPAPGTLRPLRDQDIHPSDSDGHWLPRLIIE